MTTAKSPDIDDIRKALATIKDTDGRDVIAKEMIQGLSIRNGHVNFVLDVGQTDAAPMEPLRAACERVARAVPGVTTVSTILTSEAKPGQAVPRAKHAQINAGIARETAVPSPAPKTPLPGVAAIIAVASGKGGVGKSTVAVNLALGLHAMGLKVGLLDADIYGPSVPRLLGLTGKPVSKDGKRLEPMVAHGIKAMSVGLLVDPDQPMIWRGPVATTALTQLLNDVNWAPLDVLVVDMPPGTGDIQLTMAQRVPLAGAVIVSTPQDIALIDARKGLAMFRRVAVPVFGIVENMSVYVCPKCGHADHIFGEGGATATAKELGVPVLGEIPLRRIIRETSDAGTPIVALDPGSPDAKAFMALAVNVLSAMASSDARPAPRIVMLP